MKANFRQNNLIYFSTLATSKIVVHLYASALLIINSYVLILLSILSIKLDFKAHEF